MLKNGLIKLRIILKFITPQPTINILPNISRSNDNHIMRLGQLTENNMRDIFLKKSYIRFDGEASPRPFSKKSKWSISLDQQSEIL